MSFTTVELILLILIVLIVLIVFVMLVRNEIKEYLSSKNTKLVTEDDLEVNKKVVRKETINLDDNYVKEREEVVLPKPSKSSIIIEEEDEYFDPLFDEEDLDLTQSINLKDEIHINDVKHLDDVKEDLDKVQYVIDLEDKKDKDCINYEDTITNFELEQEENAIISLEELVQKGKNMYAKNELTQYADEGNEPISLKELEEKSVLSTPSFQENFSIAEVVPKEEILEESNNTPQTIKLDDFNTVKPDNEVIVNSKKFKSSPIISPIYGIEKNDIELENTANYEKLDAEIKRTNEFLMTLKDLQKKLD